MKHRLELTGAKYCLTFLLNCEGIVLSDRRPRPNLDEILTSVPSSVFDLIGERGSTLHRLSDQHNYVNQFYCDKIRHQSGGFVNTLHLVVSSI